MKIYKLSSVLGLGLALSAPISANAQFINPGFNPAGGFFAARPFTFRTFGNNFFVTQPIGFNPNFVTGNPFANMIGRGPLFVNPNSPGVLGGFNGSGVLATGFNSGAFPGALSPGLINSGAVLGGFVPVSPNPRLTNQTILNPFIDPSGGFFNPTLQGNGTVVTGGGLSPIVTGSVVVPDPFFGTTIINRGVGAATGPTTWIDSAVPQDISGMVTSRIVGSRILLRYTGDLSVVRSITFSLLDANRRSLSMVITNRSPAEASLRLSSRARFYRATIEYLNGQVRTVEGIVDVG